eukprot:c14398_g1_i1 orf=219-566(-)
MRRRSAQLIWPRLQARKGTLGLSYEKLAHEEDDPNNNNNKKKKKKTKKRTNLVKLGRLLRIRHVSRLRLKWLSPLWLLKRLIAIYASLLVPNESAPAPYLMMGLHWTHPLLHPPM